MYDPLTFHFFRKYRWWFPEIGVPPNHPFQIGTFNYKPTILDTPLYANPHILTKGFIYLFVFFPGQAACCAVLRSRHEAGECWQCGKPNAINRPSGSYRTPPPPKKNMVMIYCLVYHVVFGVDILCCEIYVLLFISHFFHGLTICFVWPKWYQPTFLRRFRGTSAHFR